ncbi:HEPN domain-containing protein [Beduini massiliensis]|uniref:HEPN domain-containing protein n=1 Tax=Beduini massiliensis TaxID=1585974 RepID=UPI00059A92E8|nr:HEPN domain-containing protein [Beduini massiliensis]
MKVAEHKIKELLDLTEVVVEEGIKAVYEYQKTNSYLPNYYRYPELFLKGMEETENFKELQETVDVFKYGIPFFYSTNYNTPKKYDELFNLDGGQFRIACRSLNGFRDLTSFLNDNEDVSVILAGEDKDIDFSVVIFIANIVNRYLYETELFQEGDIDNKVIKSLIKKQLIRFYAETLPVAICIPICFLEFEADEIAITDSISISRMSQEFQISRYNTNHFDSTQENQLVQCAGFMIRLKGYSINNKDRDSMNNAASNYWVYPTELIDDLFASIRIILGCTTGYGQLIIEPENWADKWTTNMIPLYGATVRAFNRKESETKFLGYHIKKVNQEQVDAVRELFFILQEKRKQGKKNKAFKKVFIAVQRLNRCMLREAEDDMALDAIIGIETLLSGDTHGEITYTISNRISVVAAKLKECIYSPAEARKSMRIIYGLRSDIVHGRSLDKNSKIKIGEKIIETKELAIEFLRYSLLFIMRNQEYLEVAKFEEALDDYSEK